MKVWMLTLSVFLWVAYVTCTRDELVIYRSDPSFKVDVSTLEMDNYIRGGAGGVFIVKSKEQSYTLKFNRDLSHFQEEIIADKLYSVLGVRVPRFMVVNNFSRFSQPLKEVTKYIPFVRIAEFIAADHTETDEKLVEHFHDTFLIDAFLANRDANKPGNGIFKNGIYHRIDNGGSLRNRSLGKKKGTKRSDYWDSFLIPELRTFVRYHPRLYESVPQDVIVTQAKAIVAQASVLMDSLNEVASALIIDATTREELSNMIYRRLQVLQMLIQPGTAFPAESPRPVTSLTGAGTFLVCDIDKIPHVLLGARRSSHADTDGRWVTFGGKSDFGEDADLQATAHREIYEESNGLIDLRAEFENAPFHDLVHSDYLFRQYFIRVTTCPDAESVNQGKVAHSLKHNSHTGKSEYHRFAWRPLAEVMNITAEGAMGAEGEKAYMAFATMLQVPHVHNVLKQLLRGEAITEHRQTQSMPVQGSVQQVYANFVPLRKA